MVIFHSYVSLPEGIQKKHHLFRPSSEVLAAAEVYKIMAAAEALATDLQVWDLPLSRSGKTIGKNHWE
jgi:hypothetical protein